MSSSEEETGGIGTDAEIVTPAANHSQDTAAVPPGLVALHNNVLSQCSKRVAKATATEGAVVPGAQSVPGVANSHDNGSSALEALRNAAVAKNAVRDIATGIRIDSQVQNHPVKNGSSPPGAQPVCHAKQPQQQQQQQQQHLAIIGNMEGIAQEIDPIDKPTTNESDDQAATNEPDTNTGGVLAVANAIVDEAFPHAIAYDHNAKRPTTGNPRKKWFLLVFALVILLAIGGLAAGLLLSSSQQPSGIKDTVNDALSQQEVLVQDMLAQALGATNVYDAIHQFDPAIHRNAIHWLAHQDSITTDTGLQDIHVDRLWQRYVLVYFYFSTSAQGPWKTCGQPTNKDRNTWLCYHSAIVTTDLPSFDDRLATRWLSPQVHECQWAGIVCDEFENDLVLRISLDGYQLSGTLPALLVQQLPYLQKLQLIGNELTGTLPDTTGPWGFHLQELWLSHNHLSGTLPMEVLLNANLQNVHLNHNLLSGTIPEAIGAASSLRVLSLSNNAMEGSLPSANFSSLTSLSSLELDYNFELSGPVPKFFFVGQLTWLDISSTGLSGTLPTEIGLARSTFVDPNYLVNIYADYTKLRGSIPTEISRMSMLGALVLSNSRLTGPLPSEIAAHSTSLFQLRINGNAGVSGPIPSELGLLSRLTTLRLERTGLSGIIPQAVCTSVLKNAVANCLADPQGGNASVTCSCCTKCCSQETGVCLENL